MKTQPRTPIPLRRKLLLLTTLGFLPVVVFAALSIFSAVKNHQAALSRSTLELSRAVASAVESELKASITVLQALAASNEVERADLAALHAELARAAAVNPNWVGLTLADASGTVLLRSTFAFGSDVGPPREKASLERTIAAREPQVGSITKASNGAFAYPVRVPIIRDGQVRYVLTAGIKPARLLEIVVRQQVPQDWVISIFDTDLRRLARSRDHEATLGGAPAPSLAALLSGGSAEGTGFTRTLEGEQIITAYTRVQPYGWVVAIGAPTALLTSMVSATLLWFALGVGASVVVSIYLARRVSRNLSFELEQVIQRATAIGTKSPAEVHPPTTAEIAFLLDKVRDADERVSSSEAASAASLTSAQEAARAKDEFLAVLSHELRNPLAPIANGLDVLDMKSNSETHAVRKIIRRQVNHMTRLVDDLLDVSRLLHGKVRVELKRLDLTLLLQQIAATFNDRNGDGQCLVLAPDGPVWINGDETRLNQIFVNLLDNAERYSNGMQIQLRLETSGDQARVRVIDNGLGIDPEKLPRIFEPFYQVDSARRGVSGAVGLGLAICKGLVELHRGAITATSRGLGTGTEFTVTLPLSRQSNAVDRDNASDAAHH
ncbi:MAG TPA: sensor histidine kinase [Ramlibacter sp.]|nr:sensor histidine kinase [Ramlibacter sp.]